jgi:hypothetical protein
VVLSDGSVQVCSPSANAELFFAIPFSYGTLCFLTAVEIDVVPYKPFIRMTYHPVRSQQVRQWPLHCSAVIGAVRSIDGTNKWTEIYIVLVILIIVICYSK